MSTLTQFYGGGSEVSITGTGGYPGFTFTDPISPVYPPTWVTSTPPPVVNGFYQTNSIQSLMPYKTMSLNAPWNTAGTATVAQQISNDNLETINNGMFVVSTGVGALDSLYFRISAANLKVINGFSCLTPTFGSSSTTSVGCEIDLGDNTQLTTITNPSFRFRTGPSANSILINFSGCALDQASVDAILVALAEALSASTVAPNSTFNDIDMSGGTNAAPGATGLAAISSITALGYVVSTN